MRPLAAAVTVALFASGCASFARLAGYEAVPTPSVAIASAEPRWVLIKNTRFGKVPSEPEYIWVEEDKFPRTFKRILFGKRSLIAPADIVAKYGPPPGGGQISSLQEGSEAGNAGAPRELAPGSSAAGARGYVVYVDTTRIVIDLTDQDGLSLGSLVSLRGETFPIVHPVTGELLGEMDEEIGTARVVEIRDRFSVAEIQSVASGQTIQAKHRVVPR